MHLSGIGSCVVIGNPQTILSKYQLALVEDKPVQIQRRGFTLAPQGGVSMVLSAKSI